LHAAQFCAADAVERVLSRPVVVTVFRSALTMFVASIYRPIDLAGYVSSLSAAPANGCEQPLQNAVRFSAPNVR